MKLHFSANTHQQHPQIKWMSHAILQAHLMQTLSANCWKHFQKIDESIFSELLKLWLWHFVHKCVKLKNHFLCCEMCCFADEKVENNCGLQNANEIWKGLGNFQFDLKKSMEDRQVGHTNHFSLVHLWMKLKMKCQGTQNIDIHSPHVKTATHEVCELSVLQFSWCPSENGNANLMNFLTHHPKWKKRLIPWQSKLMWNTPLYWTKCDFMLLAFCLVCFFRFVVIERLKRWIRHGRNMMSDVNAMRLWVKRPFNHSHDGEESGLKTCSYQNIRRFSPTVNYAIMMLQASRSTKLCRIIDSCSRYDER